MIFFVLAAFSVLLAVVRLQTQRVGDPGVIKNALIRTGASYFGFWLLGTGVFGPAGPLRIGLPPNVHMNLLWVLEGLLALVLWTSIVELALYRFRRRDLIWIVPFATLSILFGISPEVDHLTAGLVALPALARVRWRREVSTSTLSISALFGFLFILLYFFSFEFQGHPGPEGGAVLELVNYSMWVRSLALVYFIVALPRLAWGIDIEIPSIKWRLFVSHLLAGLVPVVLVFVFWGLSTYLSVNADRAQVAALHLKEEYYQLGAHLDAGMENAEFAMTRLRSWAQVREGVHPGTRVYVQDPERAVQLDLFRTPTGDAPSGSEAPGLTQADPTGSDPSPPDPTGIGDGLAEDAARTLEEEILKSTSPLPPEWQRLSGAETREEGGVAFLSSEFSEGVLVLGGEAFIAARREQETPRGTLIATVLVPVREVLGGEFERRLEARAILDAQSEVQSSGLVVNLRSDAPKTTNRPRASGAAVVTVDEWSNGEWVTKRSALWTSVGFFQAVRGLTRNLSENPFNFIPLLFLAMVAFLFVLVEVLTLGMVISMGRAVTRALTALHQGTARLREGNLRYRIPIEGRDDLWEVADSFNRMAVNLEEARDTEIEKERLEGELALAHQIQNRLLPAEAPSVPRTELAGLSLPAREVGGDYYDFVPMPSGRIGLIVADVSGKGVPAALLMSSFRASLLSQDLGDGPAEILGRLNSFLHKSVEPGRFVTAFFGILDPDTGSFLYSNAGHNPPYLIGADSKVTTLREGGLVLGLFGESHYEQAEVKLQAGDTLSLFTDGVTEAQNPDEELWGEDRFLEVMLEHVKSPCRRIVSEVLRELRRFAGDEAQSDDITILLARWRGVPVETEKQKVGATGKGQPQADPGAGPSSSDPAHAAEAEPEPVAVTPDSSGTES